MATRIRVPRLRISLIFRRIYIVAVCATAAQAGYILGSDIKKVQKQNVVLPDMLARAENTLAALSVQMLDS